MEEKHNGSEDVLTDSDFREQNDNEADLNDVEKTLSGDVSDMESDKETDNDETVRDDGFIQGSLYTDYTPEDNGSFLSADAGETDIYKRVAEIESELEFYQHKEITKQMSDDLAEIQAIDAKVTSLDDLPKVFFAFRFNPVAPMNAKEAFLAMKTIEQQTKRQKPASTGSISGTGSTDSEFFTDEELGRLSKEQLSDTRVMEKAMRSMSRLK